MVPTGAATGYPRHSTQKGGTRQVMVYMGLSSTVTHSSVMANSDVMILFEREMADAKEAEKILKQLGTQFDRNQEVERVLAAFKLDPFSILDLPYKDVTAEMVKATYRKKSLLIHPDKATHPRAKEAFDILKKAEVELSEDKKRSSFKQIVEEAEYYVNKKSPKREWLPGEFMQELRIEIKQVLIQEELRRRKLIKRQIDTEHGILKEYAEAKVEKKRQKVEDKAWDKGRDKRVDSWRSFQQKKAKKTVH
jgi:DnaJ family protein C protein 8